VIAPASAPAADAAVTAASEAAAPLPRPVSAPWPHRRRSETGCLLAVVVTVTTGMFIGVLESAIVGIAYPAIELDLGCTKEDVQWVSTAFRLTQGVVLPAGVWLCERLGLRRVYLISLALYAVGAALCGLSPNLGFLIAARVVLAVPAALTPIVCMALIYRLMPARAVQVATLIYATLVIAGPGFSPAIGGVLVQYTNWRMIFFLAIPLAALGMIAAIALLPAMPATRRRRFDLLGFLCLAVGLSALLLALSKGQYWHWDSYRILMLCALGVNALALFVVVEYQVEEPLLNLRTFACQSFVVALFVIDVIFIGLLAVISFIPQFLLQVQGLTPTNTGLVMVPQAVAWMVAMVVAGLLYRRFGPRLPACTGLLLLGGATAMLARLNVDLPRAELATILTVRAFGLGLAMIPLLGGAVSALPRELLAAGIVFRTLVQRVVAALGLAVLTAMLSARQAQYTADRFGLLEWTDAKGNPALQAVLARGQSGRLALWQETMIRSSTAAYSDVFLLLGVLTLLSVPLVFLARWGTPAATDRDAVEVGT
jgi:EmrB/QacA subfamily drug resistance transporter